VHYSILVQSLEAFSFIYLLLAEDEIAYFFFPPILAKDWIVPTVFVESLPRIGLFPPFSSNPCQGLDDSRRFHRILAKDWTIPTVFIESLPRIGLIHTFFNAFLSRQGWS